MWSEIDQAFDVAIASASSPFERASLLDAKRVSQILRRIKSSSHRGSIVAALEKFDQLVDLSDHVPERRIIPFPARTFPQE
jgi:hypothetical protein